MEGERESAALVIVVQLKAAVELFSYFSRRRVAGVAAAATASAISIASCAHTHTGTHSQGG